MIGETQEQRIMRVCNGNQEAYEFLCLWARWCHEIDDIIDGDRKGAEAIIATFALAPVVLSHSFYIRHLLALRSVVMLVINMYADSVSWEFGHEQWKRDLANCYRHAGNEMVFAVAQLCGGYEHVRTVSQEQRQICYLKQHPEAEVT